mmetsp:Transcript_49320/g.106152  ORF Transcript_49320/g.106152 Transcript_49320/m.106152 type:complete len:94 (-) Transcript_49320:260-541(-)
MDLSNPRTLVIFARHSISVFVFEMALLNTPSWLRASIAASEELKALVNLVNPSAGAGSSCTLPLVGEERSDDRVLRQVVMGEICNERANTPGG